MKIIKTVKKKMDKMWLCIPNPLSFEGNIGDNFKKFKIKFENYLVAIEADEKTDVVKVAILMNIIGDEAIEKLMKTRKKYTIKKKNKEKIIKKKIYNNFKNTAYLKVMRVSTDIYSSIE